jgi:predicted dehydrogenase
MKKLKVGIIGCGRISKEAHIPNYLNYPNIEIISLCDQNQEMIRSISSRYNLKPNSIYSNYMEMLENENFDFVDICTPGFSHYEIIKYAIECGVNVLTEKPPALSLKDFELLKNLAHTKKINVSVMMNYRYKAEILKLIAFQKEGKLGEIKKIQTIHHGPFVFNDATWLWNEKISFYLLYEYGIHFIDLQTYLCGEFKKVEFVTSKYESELQTTSDLQVVIKFMNGSSGIIDLSADSTMHSSFITWMNIYGSASDAFIKFFPPSIYLASGIHNPFKLLKNDIKMNASLVMDILKNEFNKKRINSHKLVIDSFINSLLNNTESPTSLRSLTNTMNLLEEIKKQIPSYSS